MADLDALKAQIEKLSLPDRLRLAAELLTLGKREIAATIAGNVVMEIKTAKLLAPMK